MLVVDFNLADKTMGFYGRKTTTYEDFVIKANGHLRVGNEVIDSSLYDKHIRRWEKHFSREQMMVGIFCGFNIFHAFTMT